MKCGTDQYRPSWALNEALRTGAVSDGPRPLTAPTAAAKSGEEGTVPNSRPQRSSCFREIWKKPRAFQSTTTPLFHQVRTPGLATVSLYQSPLRGLNAPNPLSYTSRGQSNHCRYPLGSRWSMTGRSPECHPTAPSGTTMCSTWSPSYAVS